MPHRHGPPRRRGVVAAAAILVVLVLGACGGGDQRPTVAAWTPRWDDVVALVPTRDLVTSGAAQATCEEVLVDLREARPTLTPGPDEAVDQAALEWITFAESTFFECFEADAGADSVTTAYDRLDQLESEVDAALDSTR